MEFEFYKYQGAGNDFILVDDRNKRFPAQDIPRIKQLCDRRFGIGSDGVLLLQESELADMALVFINPDGSRSFCGNGSRCGLRLAMELGMIGEQCSFEAIDGLHQGVVTKDLVQISMRDVDAIEKTDLGLQLDTGSPHLIVVVEDLAAVDVKAQGALIRYSQRYQAEGINVNFIKAISDDSIAIRTYERGVEDETLACGTGVTAAVLAVAFNAGTQEGDMEVRAKGGVLRVRYTRVGDGFKEVWLSGPALRVFKGVMEA